MILRIKHFVFTILIILLNFKINAQEYSKIALGSDSVFTYSTPTIKDSSSQFLKFQEYDSLPDGKWIVYKAEGSEIPRLNKYKLDVLDTTIYYYDNSEIAFIGYYKNNQKDSIWMYYWTETRTMIKAKYNKGKLSGRYLMWFYNGKIALDCYYHEGVLSGGYKKYKLDGEIEVSCLYENGKIKRDYLKEKEKYPKKNKQSLDKQK